MYVWRPGDYAEPHRVPLTGKGGSHSTDCIQSFPIDWMPHRIGALRMAGTLCISSAPQPCNHPSNDNARGVQVLRLAAHALDALICLDAEGYNAGRAGY